jgi:hypothetical protein
MSAKRRATLALLVLMVLPIDLYGDDPLPEGAVARLTSGVGPFVVAPDCKAVFMACADRPLCLREISTGKELRQFEGIRTGEGVSYLDLTPDGKTLAVVGERTVDLWNFSDPAHPSIRYRLDERHTRYKTAFTPDGKNLAVSELGRLRLLDTTTGLRLREVTLREGDCSPLCFAPDGRTLAMSGYGEIHLFDAENWSERNILGVRGCAPVVFSPDGHLLAISGSWCIHIWEAAAGRQLRRRIDRTASSTNVLAFSPDGRHLAFGGKDRVVFLHEVISGRIVHAFRGHTGAILPLAFTPDGRRLLSRSSDATVLVWDMGAVPAPVVRESRRTSQELDALWEALGGDGQEADEAMRQMATCPAQTVGRMQQFLNPIEKGLTERISGWVRDLDAEDFEMRQRASARLAEVDQEAGESLRLALEKEPSLEMRRRILELLERSKRPSPQRLRVLRSVQLLEWLGTPQARRILEALATGAPEAEQTRAAASALARLSKR